MVTLLLLSPMYPLVAWLAARKCPGVREREAVVASPERPLVRDMVVVACEQRCRKREERMDTWCWVLPQWLLSPWGVFECKVSLPLELLLL